MRPLEREGAIEYWDDRSLKGGDLWQVEIQAALARSRMAILLISADFLASEFAMLSELPVLLAAAEKRGTKILPVILKPSRFLRDPRLSGFQAINDPRRPLIGLPEVEQEEVYARLADRIENEVRGSTQIPRSTGKAVEPAAAAGGAPRRGGAASLCP